jgi:NitT/TauT family transport system substrate-binding protein
VSMTARNDREASEVIGRILRSGRAAWLLAALAILILGAGAGCGGDDDDDGGGSGGLDQVKVQLDYVIRGNHAPFFVADEKGFFEREGIEIENVQEGTGSADAMRIVGSGGADFGFGDLPTLALARSQGLPVRSIAAVNQHSPLAFCAKADKFTLSEPSDLEDKRVSVHPGQSTDLFYRAFVAANDVDSDSIEERTVEPPYENYLLQDRVDVVPCYIDAEVPILEEKAGGDGSLSIMLGADHGYEALGSGLFTNEELIESDPDLVQRFTNAYLEGLQWVIDHPEESAALLAETRPQLAESEGLFTAQLQADIDNTFTSPVTEQNGLGYADPKAWDATVRILDDQGVLEESIEPGDAFDNQFAEKAGAGG